MPYEKEEDERSENQPTPEVRAEDKLVCTMPYEKEEDERSENQNRPWAGRGYDDYYIGANCCIITIRISLAK